MNKFRGHIEMIVRDLKRNKVDLSVQNIPDIIELTSFKFRRLLYEERCICYQQKNPCHGDDSLSCLLCYCLAYDTSTKIGGCLVGSDKGNIYEGRNSEKIWDCSNCNYNHHPDVVRAFLIDNIDRLKNIK